MKYTVANILICGFMIVVIKLYVSSHENATKLSSSKMTEEHERKIYSEHQRFVSTIQMRCQNETRCGPKSDSGYTVCIDRPYKPRTPCLVYSFGSHFDFGFETDVKKKFKCEIHTFDPSARISGHHIPKGINFHLIGLSGTDSTNGKGWELKTLSTIRKSLNHTYIFLDILKIDIEGYEWKALPQILSSKSYTYVRQIVIEFHFGKVKRGLDKDKYMTLRSNYWGDVESSGQLDVLRKLQMSGFRVFYFEKNPRTRIRPPASYNHSIFTCNIISLVNINFKDIPTKNL